MRRFPYWIYKGKIKAYWKKRWVRRATALLALMAAFILQYYLSNRTLPIDITDAKHKYAPATARLRQEELVIENPNIDSSRALILLRGRMGEFVNLHFETARLSEESLALFQNKPPLPPSNSVTVDLLTDEARRLDGSNENQEDSGGKTCLVSVDAGVAPDSNLPTKIHFYQSEDSKSGRDFYMTLDADLVITTSISPPEVKPHHVNSLAPGCGRRLKVGDWEWHNTGPWEIKVIAAANSILHFTFLQDKPDSLWKGTGDLFQPFAFASMPLRAKAVSINPLSGNRPSTSSSTPVLYVSVKNGPPLNINNLSLNAEEIQLDFSGEALVQTRDGYFTENLLDRLKKYPLIAVLLGIGDAALVGWFISIFKGILFGQGRTG